MTKILVKIVLFIILILVASWAIEPYFIKEDRFNYPKYKFEKLADITNFGILFFGSSKSYCAYNPTIFKYNLGANSFNLAGQGQVLEVTDFIIEEALKLNKPKLILVDLSYAMIRFQEDQPDIDRKKSYQLKIFDNYRYSTNKIKHLANIFDGKDLFYSLSPIIRNHDFWMDIPKQKYKLNYLHDKNNMFLANNGYIGTMHKMSKEGIELANEIDLGYEVLKNRRNLTVDSKELDLISKIYEYATKRDVKVLFITSPSIEGMTKHLSFYEDLEDHLNNLGIDYLNLNKSFKEIGLQLSDFKDHQHLNFYGGQKTSQFVSNYLSNNYSFDSNSNRNLLDNNVTFNLLSDLVHTNKVLTKQFEFNEKLKVDEIGYFEENLNQFVFVFRFGSETSKNTLSDFRGYIRYYNGEINEENKQVHSFPVETIEMNNQTYAFARVLIENPSVSRFDVFFIHKKTNKPTKFLKLKNVSLKAYDLNRELF